MIKDFVALDLETTGLSPYEDKIIEVGAAKYSNGLMTDKFVTFVNPEIAIPEIVQNITGINDHMVENAPTVDIILPKLLEFLGDACLLGHNINFDYSFIAQNALNLGLNYKAYGIDTFKVSKRVLKNIKSRSLESLCSFFGIETIHHRAYDDAVSSATVYERLCEIEDSDEDLCILSCKPKKISPATEKQINFLKSLIGRYNIEYDKNIKDLTKSQASKEIDKILSTYGIRNS